MVSGFISGVFNLFLFLVHAQTYLSFFSPRWIFRLPLIVQNVGSFDVATIFRLLRMFRAIGAERTAGTTDYQVRNRKTKTVLCGVFVCAFMCVGVCV